jgi:hypothetical protein
MKEERNKKNEGRKERTKCFCLRVNEWIFHISEGRKEEGDFLKIS